jgi:hypothetical protein
MKQSQIVVLSAFALVALGMILSAGIARVALSQLAPEVRDRSPQEPGAQATRTLDLDGFRGIAVRGVWRVTLVRSDEWSVELSFPENFADHLQVRVQGDRLVVEDSTRDRSRRGSNDRFSARVSMPELTSAEISGTSAFDFSGFNGERLTIRVSGAAEIQGDASRYRELELAVSGAGRADLRGVTVVDAFVNLSGAGRASLALDGGVLSGNLSGAGRVDYSGSVREQRVRTSGAGSVTRLD